MYLETVDFVQVPSAGFHQFPGPINRFSDKISTKNAILPVFAELPHYNFLFMHVELHFLTLQSTCLYSHSFALHVHIL